MQSRLHLIPKYRKRLQAPAPGVLNPVWIDDAGFDLGYHVRRVALPGPSSDLKAAEQLELVVGNEMSRKLDRSRPLWELTVVDGLPSGRVALLTKLHHAPVDGMGAVDYALHRAALADVKAAGKGAGGTVNDAILCVVAGTLRRYLDAAGVVPSSPPVALIPVSVRKAGEEGGNRISTVLVDLPVHEADPRERIRIINAAMAEIKDSAAVRAGALAVAAGGWAPPLVSSGLARAMGGVRAFNLVVSNVPGPQATFYMNGSRMLEAYPCVPLNPANQGLSVGVISYDGGVGFGLMADRDLDPPLSVAADSLRASVAELVASVVR